MVRCPSATNTPNRSLAETLNIASSVLEVEANLLIVHVDIHAGYTLFITEMQHGGPPNVAGICIYL